MGKNTDLCNWLHWWILTFIWCCKRRQADFQDILLSIPLIRPTWKLHPFGPTLETWVSFTREGRSPRYTQCFFTDLPFCSWQMKSVKINWSLKLWVQGDVINLSASTVRMFSCEYCCGAPTESSVGPSGRRPSPNLIYSTRDGVQPPVPMLLLQSSCSSGLCFCCRSRSQATAERQASQDVAELWCHHPL